MQGSKVGERGRDLLLPPTTPDYANLLNPGRLHTHPNELTALTIPGKKAKKPIRAVFRGRMPAKNGS
ncbi:MAG: hypothetical protein KA314_07775 [Chloroflexi bacterium]|nr:hypothetical protein [Chloroflexota bacterium]MBP8055727.1 hypothetical protein [Chloroflexota bacterium]